MNITVKCKSKSDSFRAVSQNEFDSYVRYAKEKYPDRKIEKLTVELDGDFVNLRCDFAPDVPFERIRRITGYLVGTLDRFNNGKRAEVLDRVKHGTEESE